MPITGVSQYHQAGYPGDIWGDLRTVRTASARNNGSTDLVYGVMVADDSAGTNGSSRAVRAISSASDVLKGILIRRRYHAPSALYGIDGLAPDALGVVLRGGKCLVTTEQLATTASSVYVRWGAGSASSGTTAWAASTAYTLNQRRTNGGLMYEVITAGTSASSGGPTGVSQDITDGTVHWKYVGVGITADLVGAFRTDADIVTAWASSTAYTVGQRRENDTGKVYEVITAGTSDSSGGPTGTTADITDNTVHWKYVGVCDSSTRASAIVVSNASWVIGTAEMDTLNPAGVAVLELNMP